MTSPLGQLFGGALGSIRMTSEGQGGDFSFGGNLVDVPVNDSNLKRQVVGSKSAECSWNWAGQAELLALLAYQDAQTDVPNARWPLLATDSTLDSFGTVIMGRIAGIDSTEQEDQVTVKEVRVAPSGGRNFHWPGILFDWQVDASPGGVTAAQDGAWIEVGALSAGESYDIWLFSLHDPAPTTSSTVWLVEECTDGAGTGLATVATSPGAFPNLSTTPLWAVVSIDGAWTPGWLRLGVELPADGTSYPICIVTKRLTTDPPT